MEDYFICEECGEKYPSEEAVCVDDTYLCSDCAERLTVVCRNCGERVWTDNTVDDDLCDTCYDSYYVRCDDCGCVIHRNDAYYTELDENSHSHPYCESCYHKHDDEPYIHDYYYKPDPVFFGSDDALYMGIELEIDEGGEDIDCAEMILNTANSSDKHVYLKHDGSLNYGFEIVSHPMTLNYHKSNMPWRGILRKAINMGYKSHQAVTCGLHIHVSKPALGDSYEERENVIARLVYFYEKFWAEILRFSRRTEATANRWASRYGGVLSTCKNSLDTAKKAGLGRYTAVNLSNDSTVEFRIFRGTLRYETFISTLEFTHYLCKLAMKLSDELFQSMSWLDFVSGIDKAEYPELIDYLKLRGLYINEPIKEMEEI